MDINFQNPTEISDKEFASLVSLDFSNIGTPVDDAPAIEDSKPESKSEEKPAEETKPAETKTTDKPAEISLGKTEGSEDEEPEGLTALVNFLAEKNIITEAYEGFDPDQDADEEVFVKLLEHNIEKKVQEEFEEFFETISDTTRRILEFDMNSKDKSQLTYYLQTLLAENTIKDLSATDPVGQEKILREWYRGKEGFTPDEVEEKISNLREAGLLEKEAKMIKPKLDKAAEEIAKYKEEQQRYLKNMEAQVKEDFSSRLIDVFKKGKVGDIPLSKEEAARIHTILTSDEIEVTTHGNRKALMSPMEAIVFYNKYDPKGSLENLALATLLLTDPEKFEKAYANKVKTTETKKFIQEHKYGKIKGVESKGESKPQEKPNIKWNLKI